MRLIRDLEAGALKVVTAIDAALDDARRREHALIATAIATHSGLPDNYWQERHRLQCQSGAAHALLDAIREVRGSWD